MADQFNPCEEGQITSNSCTPMDMDIPVKIESKMEKKSNSSWLDDENPYLEQEENVDISEASTMKPKCCRKEWCKINWKKVLTIALLNILFIIAVVMTTLYVIEKQNPTKVHNKIYLPEKTLYAFWGQGESKMSDFIKLMTDNLRKNIPNDMTLVIVTQDNYLSYIDQDDLPDKAVLRWLIYWKQFATLKDLILFSILAKNGGIVTDITNILYKGRAEQMWKHFKENDYDSFFYTYDKGWQEHHDELCAVWWIMAKRGSKVMEQYLKTAKKATIFNTGYYAFGKNILQPIIKPILAGDNNAVIPRNKLWTYEIGTDFTPQYNGINWEELKEKDKEVSQNEGDKKVEHSWAALRFQEDDESTLFAHQILKRILTDMKEKANINEIPFVKLFNSGGPVCQSLSLNEIFEKNKNGFRILAYFLAQAACPTTALDNLADHVGKLKYYWTGKDEL